MPDASLADATQRSRSARARSGSGRDSRIRAGSAARPARPGACRSATHPGGRRRGARVRRRRALGRRDGVDRPSSRGSTRARTRSRRRPATSAAGSAASPSAAASSGRRQLRPISVWKIGEDGQLVSSIKLAAARREPDVRRRSGLGVGRARQGRSSGSTRPRTRRRSYRLGHHVLGVAVRNGLLAVGVQPSGRDVTAGLKGRVVPRRAEDNDLDWTSDRSARHAVRVQRRPGAVPLRDLREAVQLPGRLRRRRGSGSCPEVAAGWPNVTDGGRTYTFRIRPRLRLLAAVERARDAPSRSGTRSSACSRRRAAGPWSLARRRRRREGVPRRARRHTSPASRPAATRS